MRLLRLYFNHRLLEREELYLESFHLLLGMVRSRHGTSQLVERPCAFRRHRLERASQRGDGSRGGSLVFVVDGCGVVNVAVVSCSPGQKRFVRRHVHVEFVVGCDFVPKLLSPVLQAFKLERECDSDVRRSARGIWAVSGCEGRLGSCFYWGESRLFCFLLCVETTFDVTLTYLLRWLHPAVVRVPRCARAVV